MLKSKASRTTNEAVQETFSIKRCQSSIAFKEGESAQRILTLVAVVAAGIETVRHVRPDLDALHLRQASLGVRLPREQGKRRDDYCDVLSHGQRT